MTIEPLQDSDLQLPGTAYRMRPTARPHRFGCMSWSHFLERPKLPSSIRRNAAQAFRSWLNLRSRLQTASARCDAARISSSWSALLSITISSRCRVERSSSATFKVRTARNRSSSVLLIDDECLNWANFANCRMAVQRSSRSSRESRKRRTSGVSR